MIQIKAEYAEAYIKKLLEQQSDEKYLLIFDVDDLHDYTIEYSEDVERVYWALYALLPVIFDNITDFIDCIQDYEEICDYAEICEGSVN